MYRPRADVGGVFEDPKVQAIPLEWTQKKGLWLLWVHRKYYNKKVGWMGFVLWGCPDLCEGPLGAV